MTTQHGKLVRIDVLTAGQIVRKAAAVLYGIARKLNVCTMRERDSVWPSVML